jgi:DNA-binding NarL/FixJ family response regulator
LDIVPLLRRRFSTTLVDRPERPGFMRNLSPLEPRPHFLIADDHAMFAEALRVYLEKTCTVVGVVLDGRAMVDVAVRLKPNVIIVDVGMPLLNGLDAARRVREQVPDVRFIFLTMQDDPNLAAAALELGPIAFVLKHSAGPELMKAIDHVLRGQSYLTPRLRSVDWVQSKARAKQFTMEMTSRQRDVVQMLAEGRPMKEIAGVLDLSEKTVEFHKHHIMDAFNLKSNADLVLFALRRGLISANIEPRISAEAARRAGQFSRLPARA